MTYEIARHGQDEVGVGAVHFVRYFPTISIVMSVRRLTNSGPEPVMLLS
jgi:hypothetical protein